MWKSCPFTNSSATLPPSSPPFVRSGRGRSGQDIRGRGRGRGRTGSVNRQISTAINSTLTEAQEYDEEVDPWDKDGILTSTKEGDDLSFLME